MQITVNGKPAQATDNITVTELLAELKVETPEYVSVELNGEILDRQDFGTIVVSEGDVVEFLYYMGGGAR
ncbi:MAG: sulfur carrier protein ThiS [Armatimonadetes bacterium]|nr:sulfur carrier protein ThiS [Armatimonadota bacterium]